MMVTRYTLSSYHIERDSQHRQRIQRWTTRYDNKELLMKYFAKRLSEPHLYCTAFETVSLAVLAESGDPSVADDWKVDPMLLH